MNLDDFSDSDDADDEASIGDLDNPEWVQSAAELAAKQAAEDELKKMGRDAILEQAAEAAEAVANQARSAQTSDDQILFNMAQGRLEMGEETRGVDLGDNARGAFPDDGDSSAPSDLAPLRARDPQDLPPTPPGHPPTQEVPRFLGQVRAFDDFSDVGAPTEAGFVVEARPPQGLTEIPPRPSVVTQQTDIQPDFIPDTLEENGKSVYKPDLGTDDMPYRS